MLNIQRDFNESKFKTLNDVFGYSQHLTESLGIKCKFYEDEGLFVFNYSQIDSPKTHPIVRECRGLIMDKDFDIVCKPFERFFNYGEAPDITEKFNIKDAVVYEKADGSFIKVYHWDGSWRIATRGTAFAESENYTGRLFVDMVLEAFGCVDISDFNEKMSRAIPEHLNLFFEFTSPHNRVVTPYTRPEMVYLGTTSKIDGSDLNDLKPMVFVFNTIGLKVRAAKAYKFSSVEDMKLAVDELTGLEEGYVAHDLVSDTRIKLKSPQYVAVHLLRGEGIPTPKRIAQNIVIGEVEEYLAYFNEDRNLFTPYIETYEKMLDELDVLWETVKHITDQKEFALAIKYNEYAHVMFRVKQGQGTPRVVFSDMKIKAKTDFLLRKHANVG